MRSLLVSIFLMIVFAAKAHTPKPSAEEILEEALAAATKSKDCITHTYRFKEITDGENCGYSLESVANDSGEIIKTFQAKNNQNISRYKLTYLTTETLGDDGPTDKTLSIKGTITHRIYGDYVVDIEKKKEFLRK